MSADQPSWRQGRRAVLGAVAVTLSLASACLTATGQAAASSAHRHHRPASAATSFTVRLRPTAVAGSRVVLTVTAVTRAGRRARNYRGTVKLTSSDPTAQLPRRYRFKAADAGRHTFPAVVLHRAGRQSITVRAAGRQRIAGRNHVAVRVPPPAARPTTTAVSCSPTAVQVNRGTTSCGVLVSDAGSGTATHVAGSVRFTSSGAGSFVPSSARCRLPDAGFAVCDVTYLPSAAGLDTITARFVPSDTSHRASSARTHVAACASTWTVDAATGVDQPPAPNTMNGSCAAPFKTLTYALSQAGAGDTVQVDPGTYDAANGETFPLDVPSGVTIVGDPASQGTSPATEIAGNVVLDQPQSSVQGVSVAGAVDVTGSGVGLIGDTLTNPGGTCLTVTGAISTTISNTTASGCGLGIQISGGASATLGLDTLIGASTYNLEVDDTSTANLANGGNTLSCAAGADLYAATSAAIDASNTAWDHAPPTMASAGGPTGGIDVYQGGLGAVTTTNPIAVTSPCL